jgi:hypothetical protein
LKDSHLEILVSLPISMHVLLDGTVALTVFSTNCPLTNVDAMIVVNRKWKIIFTPSVSLKLN